MVKRVLITGAGGFIGRACLAPLAERGYEIHGVTRSAVVSSPETRWHSVDLLDTEAVDALVAEVRPTHLLHLAWVTEPGRYQRSAENFRWVRASLALLEGFARNGGERCVGAGSCAEYDSRLGVCSERTTALAPTSPYGVCKHALQLMLRSFSEFTGISSAWGRVFSLYGPHEHPQRLVPSLARAILAGEEAPCTVGDQVRDYLHVEDVAAAFVALVDSAASGSFNIASGDGVPVRELARMIGEACGRPDLVRLGGLPARPDDPAELVGDASRLHAETGWKPRWGLCEGIESTVRWWAEARGTQERSVPCD